MSEILRQFMPHQMAMDSAYPQNREAIEKMEMAAPKAGRSDMFYQPPMAGDKNGQWLLEQLLKKMPPHMLRQLMQNDLDKFLNSTQFNQMLGRDQQRLGEDRYLDRFQDRWYGPGGGRKM